jgi:hypothetical protein
MKVKAAMVFVIVFVLACTLDLSAQDPAGLIHTFKLTWQAQGVGDVIYLPLNRKKPFAKEPNLAPATVLRGQLGPHVGSKGTGGIGLIWNRSKHTLRVDLNGDGDLTNDPNGVFTSKNERQYYHAFPEFSLNIPAEKGLFRYRVSADIYDYEWETEKRLNIHIRSGYGGTVDLHGVRWRVGVNDRIRGGVSKGNRMTIRPIGVPKPSGYETNQLSWAVWKSLFLNGRCYDLDFDFHRGADAFPTLRCTMIERTVRTDTLQIEGQFIDQLVLSHGDILVFPPLQPGAVTVPIGEHCQVQVCRLAITKNTPDVSPLRVRDIRFQVNPSEGNALHIGGPLQNTLQVERVGRVMKFNYELRGIGGELYDAQQVTQYDQKKRPSVTVYKGKMKLMSGQFEYG